MSQFLKGGIMGFHSIIVLEIRNQGLFSLHLPLFNILLKVVTLFLCSVFSERDFLRL